MNIYYIIDEGNKIVDEFEADKLNCLGKFESWLNDKGGLKEFLRVKKIKFGKLQIAQLQY